MSEEWQGYNGHLLRLPVASGFKTAIGVPQVVGVHMELRSFPHPLWSSGDPAGRGLERALPPLRHPMVSTPGQLPPALPA